MWFIYVNMAKSNSSSSNEKIATNSIWPDSWNIYNNFANISWRYLRFKILFLDTFNVYFSYLSF